MAEHRRHVSCFGMAGIEPTPFESGFDWTPAFCEKNMHEAGGPEQEII
jgi:hypothetical protein